jgi:Acyl-CoA reductase (LuxC)
VADARTDAALTRVTRLRAAARELTRCPAALVAALADSTGLSKPGVELGLRMHLEHDATDAELMQLVQHATTAQHIDVVLSANVFTAAFRAIALALARSAHVVVKPSRREPHFVRALHMHAPNLMQLAPDWQPESTTCKVVHAYARDATLIELRERLPKRVQLWGHGSGFGIALLNEADDTELAAIALAADVVAFDQRGCLSPRVMFVLGSGQAGRSRTTHFAAAMANALRDAGRAVPRGTLLPEERAEHAQYLQTAECLGDVDAGAHHTVSEFPLTQFLLPPTGRVVHVTQAASVHEVCALIGPLARFVTCIGSNGNSGLELGYAHARQAKLGAMQRPRLDGPVDARTPEPRE